MTDENRIKLTNLLSKGFLATIDGFNGTHVIKEFKTLNNHWVVVYETDEFLSVSRIQVEKIRVYKEVTDWQSE